MTDNSKQPIRLKIYSQAYGGYGVGKHEGRVLFVPDTIQGDEVDVCIQEEKKNFAFASVLAFVKQSPLRIPSDCPYDEKCGGCQWLSIPYETQIQFKLEFLLDALKRTGKIPLENKPHVHTSSSRYYRNRVLLRGTIHEGGRIHVGFMERSSHKQVAIAHCLNVDPLINTFIEDISKFHTACKAQKFRIEVQVLPASQRLLLVLHSLHGVDSLGALKKELSQNKYVQWVGLSSELVKAPFFLFEKDLDCEFFTSPGAFQQVNVPLNHEVRRLIYDFIKEKNIKSVLDLFCGSGNLSLALAKPGSSVLGVEQSNTSIRIANHNVVQNKIQNARYECAPAHSFLKGLVQSKASFDLLIVDPPRKGMKECIDSIKKLKVPYLIYMSCDPVTLARDLKELSDMYEIRETHIFDFFANTEHLESLVFLSLRKNLPHLQVT